MVMVNHSLLKRGHFVSARGLGRAKGLPAVRPGRLRDHSAHAGALSRFLAMPLLSVGKLQALAAE